MVKKQQQVSDFNRQCRKTLSSAHVVELLKQESDDVIVALLSSRFGFGDYMNVVNMSDELVKLFLKLINKGFKSNALKANHHKLIGRLLQSNYLNKHVFNMIDNANQSCDEDFICDCIWLFNYIMTMSPNDIKMLDPFNDTLELVINSHFKIELSFLFDAKIATLKRKTQKTTGKKQQFFDDPLECFYELPIVPCLQELLSPEEQFLRKNIIQGAYRDLTHYLDVHYRLLREDFLSPLRDGIKEIRKLVSSLPSQYKSNQTARALVSSLPRLDSVSISFNVKLTLNLDSNERLSYFIEIDTNIAAEIVWEKSKRFMFGSLVFLSNDFFRENFIVAVVNNCDLDKAREGLISVCLNQTSNFSSPIDLNSKYIMLETNAYFESYKHVLHAFRTLHELGATRFPFKEHIVDARNAQMMCPDYLYNKIVDFSPLLKKPSMFAGKQLVSNPEKWPKADDMGLDSSQYDAIKLALTKKIAIIQGPPGTGKTFIGVKLVQLLVHNKHLWCDNSNRMRPILMICYTNHALDQFLEYIVEQCNITKGVVRVGGRSKSETLSHFFLKNIKQDLKNRRTMPSAIHQALQGKYSVLRAIEMKLNSNYRYLTLANDCILRLDTLIDCMEAKHTNAFESDDDLLEWLGFDALSHREIDTLEAKLGDLQLIDSKQLNDDYDPCRQDVDDEKLREIHSRMLDDDYQDEEHEWITKHQEKMLQLREQLGFREEDIYQLFSQDCDWIQVGAKERRQHPIRDHFHSIVNNLDDALNLQVDDIWSLGTHDRIRLYKYWVSCYRDQYQQKINRLKLDHDIIQKEMAELRLQEDRYIMQKSFIVAMTTTGSARYHSILRDIGPRIVIVEEAAEVFEAHVVASLSEKCEHLILIGDHVQLRPKPNVYTLEKDYHLDVSLFERLILNGVPSVQLNTQHRMRPEISVLMKHFYPKAIQDAENVFRYPKIQGLNKDIVFINHKNREKAQKEGSSKLNTYEAQYLVAFCQYLLRQKYTTSQITILTTYLGQCFLVRDHLRRAHLEEVECSTVDNFQGEENDIILLSLVRSNEHNVMGFLKIKNRICVALSRAKWGFYCIGNFDMLATNDFWSEIVKTFSTRAYTDLILTCNRHPQNNVKVEAIEDFHKRTDGGCELKCDFVFICGHQCPLHCHLYDQEHIDIRCTIPCRKPMNCGHKCQEYCSHEGECDPLKCRILVVKKLPCGHSQRIPCGKKPEMQDCTAECREKLECGHSCTKTCSQKCSPCETKVKMTSVCAHKIELDVLCGTQSWKLQSMCTQPCLTVLECGHMCKGRCGDCLGGRVHVACQKNCTRSLACGHICSNACAKQCVPCKKFCRNRCAHSRCLKKCSLPCNKCKEPCVWQCDHKKCTRLCHEDCNRGTCDRACTQILKCNHRCIGFCGEPCPTQCRVCDVDEVLDPVFGTEKENNARFVLLEDCGHVFEAQGLKRWLVNNYSSNHPSLILPSCPKCKSPMRRNFRFASFIKPTLRAIEQEKGECIRKLKNHANEKNEFKAKLKKERITEFNAIFLDKTNKFVQQNHRDLTIHQMFEIQKRLDMHKTLFGVYSRLLTSKIDNQIRTCLSFEIKKLKQMIESHESRYDWLSNQRFNELKHEIQRLDKILSLALAKSDKTSFELLIGTTIPYNKMPINSIRK